MQIFVLLPHILEAMPLLQALSSGSTDKPHLPDHPSSFSFLCPQWSAFSSQGKLDGGVWKNLCQPSPFLDYPQIEVDPAIASVRPWPGHKFPQRVNLGPSNWLTPFLACLPCQASVAGRGTGQDSCGGSRHWLYRWIMESWLYLCCCEVVGIPKKGLHSRI